MDEKIRAAIEQHIAAASTLLAKTELIGRIASALITVAERGGKILICGNGGSAADSQHIAAELVGRFKKERRPAAALALTADTSVLTSLANDYGFDKVFERQVMALGARGDAVIGLSTSGASPNVANALKKARELGLLTIGLLGRDGGLIKQFCDHALVIENADTPRVQEMHILAAHIICELIENEIERQKHPS
ncbi:MAG: SIS domain-containing protein [Elusimicrobia bacterium]|nr:SIS domain-containing protein [Elusimicrobiota bacterium]